MSTEHSTHTARQDGPPSPQARLELPNRRNSAHEASLRRRKIFWLSILCWLMVLCLTAIIIIAVVHFQGSNNEIDQISAGALIGFGVLLIFVVVWLIIVYLKFNRSRAGGDTRQYRPSREEFETFASSEIFNGRGVSSTISTVNSTSNSRSTEGSAERDTQRFIYRQRFHDDERRRSNRITEAPLPSISSSSRIAREHHGHGPGLGRPQMPPHVPERRRTEHEPSRVFVDTSSRAARRHSAPLPPPYLPTMSPPYRISESLPTGVMGTPPPAYDRVCGRSHRLESTTSEDSCLNPPAYQSRPPSPLPSPGTSGAVPQDRIPQVNLPSHRPGVGHPGSALPPQGRVRRYEMSPSQVQQPSLLSVSGVVQRESIIHGNLSRSRPSSASYAGAQAPVLTATATRYTAPYYRLTPAPRYHTSSHLPSSTSHSAFVLPRNDPVTSARPVSPTYSRTSRSLSSRPVLSVAAPEISTRLSLPSLHVPNRPPSPIQEISEDNHEESSSNRKETPTPPQDDARRPGVVLVYLSQSPDEEIIV